MSYILLWVLYKMHAPFYMYVIWGVFYMIKAIRVILLGKENE